MRNMTSTKLTNTKFLIKQDNKEILQIYTQILVSEVRQLGLSILDIRGL